MRSRLGNPLEQLLLANNLLPLICLLEDRRRSEPKCAKPFRKHMPRLAAMQATTSDAGDLHRSQVCGLYDVSNCRDSIAAETADKAPCAELLCICSSTPLPLARAEASPTRAT